MDRGERIRLVAKVVEWGNERGFVKKENTKNQVIKLFEEWGELVTAVFDDDMPEIIDAIGDIQVVTILLCEMNGFDYDAIYIDALSIKEEIHPMTSNGLIAENILKGNLDLLREGIVKSISSLLVACHTIEVDKWEALETAYNVIANRTGKVVDGTYIKDEDLGV